MSKPEKIVMFTTVLLIGASLGLGAMTMHGHPALHKVGYCLFIAGVIVAFSPIIFFAILAAYEKFTGRKRK